MPVSESQTGMLSGSASPAAETAAPCAPSRKLASRKLATGDVLLAGLRVMLGAGLFAALGAAADEAGGWVLLSWVIAASAAALCAASAVRLADGVSDLVEVLHPKAQSTHPKLLRSLAACSLFCGQITACCVLALAIATYTLPDALELGAAGAVVVGVLANRVHWADLLGTRKQTSGTPAAEASKLFARRATVRESGVTANRLIAWFVLLVLLLVVVTSASSRQTDMSKLSEGTGASWGIVTAAGLLFFAFAGYARTADLRSSRPQFSIPWGTAGSIAAVAAIYILTSFSLFASASPANLAIGDDPFVQAAHFGGFNRLGGIIRLCVTIACAGVLLPLLRSISKPAAIAFAFGKPDSQIVRHSDVATGAAVLVLALLVSLRAGLAFSAFCALVYGAVLCALALLLPRKPVKRPPEGTLDDRIREFHRLEPRPASKRKLARRERISQRAQSRAQIAAEIIVRVAAACGLIGCLILAFSLPPVPMVAAAGVVVVGTAVTSAMSSPKHSSPYPYFDEPPDRLEHT